MWGLVAALAVVVSGASAEPVVKTYAPTDAVITNPERGMYMQVTARGQAEPLDADRLAALRDGHMTLILRLYYLNEFRDKPIDDARLELIADDLSTVRDAGIKCLLRFAYNERIGDPDAPIDVVLGHMEQLKPILSANADVIAVVQAGFVGSWGEWHASTNDLREPENAQRIIAAWLDILPASRYVQVRTPLIKQMLVETDATLAEDEAYTDSPRARIAHHNDCFLATDTDMGTYQDIPAEKAYLEQETRFLPMGGETCHVSEYNAEDNARKELKRFHWSYLHRDYHPDVIGAWRDSGFLEEVKKHLGYRLVLEEAASLAEVDAGAILDVSLKLSNRGWAAPYNPRSVELVLRSKSDGSLHHAALDADPRWWMPGQAVEIEQGLLVRQDTPPGEYDLLLWLPDPEPALRSRPEYAVRLANEGLWDEHAGWHDLGLSVRVNAPHYGVEPGEADGAFTPLELSP